MTALAVVVTWLAVAAYLLAGLTVTRRWYRNEYGEADEPQLTEGQKVELVTNCLGLVAFWPLVLVGVVAAWYVTGGARKARQARAAERKRLGLEIALLEEAVKELERARIDAWALTTRLKELRQQRGW